MQPIANEPLNTSVRYLIVILSPFCKHTGQMASKGALQCTKVFTVYLILFSVTTCFAFFQSSLLALIFQGWSTISAPFLILVSEKYGVSGALPVQVCFVIIVDGNSKVTHLVGLTSAWISPVYIWEAFLPPYPILISHFSFFSFRFPLVPGSKQSYTFLCRIMFHILSKVGSHIFESVPLSSQTSMARPQAWGFSPVSGHPCNRTVNSSHFGSRRRSDVLSCSVLDLSIGRLKWRADFGIHSILISDTMENFIKFILQILRAVYCYRIGAWSGFCSVYLKKWVKFQETL